MAQQHLKSFSEVVDINRERVKAGDLAESEFYKISLQKLQFEQDVSAGQVGLIQAKASLRQLMGYDSVIDDFTIDGDLAFTDLSLNLEDLKRMAMENRPDVQATHAGVQLAQDTLALEKGNKARDLGANLDYTHLGPDNGIGVGITIDLPFHDRNQGNIARSEIARAPGDRVRHRDAVRGAHRRGQRLRRVRHQPEDRRPLSVRAISIRRSSRSTSRPTSISTAPARFSICWTPNARIARRSWPTARPWRRT